MKGVILCDFVDPKRKCSCCEVNNSMAWGALCDSCEDAISHMSPAELDRLELMSAKQAQRAVMDLAARLEREAAAELEELDA